MSKNADKIKELKAQLAELEAQDAAIAAMTPEQQMAITLHEKLCHWNHTDGCGWFYEMKKGNIDDWNGSAHGTYLAKANRLIHFCFNKGIKPAAAIELMDLLEV